MRSALSTLEVSRPRTLAEATRALHASLASERLTPLAGGTDLFVYLNAGSFAGRRFLDLTPLRQLRGIREHHDALELGALATFREIREHAAVRKRFPSLAAAAAEVGALQIQNRATLGGNIANGSPAGDSLPVLMALDAAVHARSVRGSRSIAFDALYHGYRELALEPDELITAVTLRVTPPRTFQFFRKVGTRRAQSISKVVFAGVLRFGRDGAVDHARLAWGSVAPVTLRARHAEEALIGERPSRALAIAVRKVLVEEIAPIDDIRSERDYRLEVSGNLLEQFLRAADARFAGSKS